MTLVENLQHSLSSRFGAVLGNSSWKIENSHCLLEPRSFLSLNKLEYVLCGEEVLQNFRFFLKELERRLISAGLLIIETRASELNLLRLVHQVCINGHFELLDDTAVGESKVLVFRRTVKSTLPSEIKPVRYRIADALYAPLLKFPKVKASLKRLLSRQWVEGER